MKFFLETKQQSQATAIESLKSETSWEFTVLPIKKNECMSKKMNGRRHVQDLLFCGFNLFRRPINAFFLIQGGHLLFHTFQGLIQQNFGSNLQIYKYSSLIYIKCKEWSSQKWICPVLFTKHFIAVPKNRNIFPIEFRSLGQNHLLSNFVRN